MNRADATGPADTLTTRFERAYASGRYAEARDAARAEVKVRQRDQGEHPQTAAALRNLGMALWKCAEFPQSEVRIQAAIAMYKRLGSDFDGDLGVCLNLLGVVQMRQGKFDVAERSYQRSLAILVRVRGRVHEDVASVVSDIGALHQERNDHVASEPYRRTALSMIRQIYGDEHPLTAHATHNLASVMAWLGDDEQSEALYRRALTLRRKLLPTDHPDVGFTMGRLASTLARLGRNAEAEMALRESLRLQRRRLGPAHPRVLMDLSALASVIAQQGRFDEAAALRRERIERTREKHGEASRDYLIAVRGLAALFLEAGRLDEAEHWYQCAAAAREATHPGEPDAATHAGLADVRFARADYAGAESYYAFCARASELQRRKSRHLERRAGFGASLYRRLAACRLLTGKGASAWPPTEAGLGRSLADWLVAEPSHSRYVLAREDSLWRAVNALRERIAVLAADTSRGPTQAPDSLRTHLLHLEADWATARVARRDLYPLDDNLVFPLERVQAALDPKSALIGWLDVRLAGDVPAAWAYVIRNQGPVRWVRLGHPNDSPAATPPRVDSVADATALRKAFVAASSWPTRVGDAARIRWLGRRIGVERIDPLLPLLDGVEHIVVVSSETMRGLPIETLVLPDDAYVIESFGVSYAVSATIVAWLRERSDRDSRTPRRLDRGLLVGSPDFAPTGPTSSAPVALPSSEVEVRRVAALLPEATVLLGPRASEHALAELADSGRLSDFGLIHLATHTQVDDRKPANSALLLSTTGLMDPLDAALSNQPIYDGRLTAAEISARWRLNADLVTLSGCETALGRHMRGEGYLGLAHMLFRVGAKSLVVSLWRVDDEATSMLMQRFYENLTAATKSGGGRISKSAALREAKAWLAQQRDGHGESLAHPSYWSAFVLIGDPGS